jgi:hypothetical protein
MQEKRTAGVAADRLHTAGFEVTAGVGKTEVVGLLRNGDGPTKMMRADIRAHFQCWKPLDCRMAAKSPPQTAMVRACR